MCTWNSVPQVVARAGLGSLHGSPRPRRGSVGSLRPRRGSLGSQRARRGSLKGTNKDILGSRRGSLKGTNKDIATADLAASRVARGKTILGRTDLQTENQLLSLVRPSSCLGYTSQV
jgi:hypothetical protein